MTHLPARLRLLPATLLAALPALFLAALIVAAPGARAGTAADGIEIRDYGIYQLKVVRKVDAPEDVSQERNIVADITLEQETREILAIPERSFGYRFRITDPALMNSRLVLRTSFPPMTNPETGTTMTVQERPLYPVMGEDIYDGYRFDYHWEMAEGEWTFELLADGKVISRQTFKIIVAVN